MSNLLDMMEQVKSLKNGVGIQSLLDAAHKILGNPLLMFDTDYKLLSYTEFVTDDPIWNEMITYGTFSKETQEFFKDEGFIEVVANAKRITFMNSDKLKYKRILGKIFNRNNTHVANLVVVACNKPLASDDPVVFENICKLITREINKSDFYQIYGTIYQESLIKNLIEGNYEDKDLYTAHVAILYDNLKTNLYLAVVDISQCDPDYTRITYFRDLFEQIKTEYKYAIYSNYILIIISTKNEILDFNKELNNLNKLFKQNDMYVGMSGRFENLFELQKYYKDALRALKCVSEIKSSQRIFPKDISSINTMEQIRALKNGRGIQYLLNEAFKIFGNPVLLYDIDWKMMACTENVKVNDPIWEEFFTCGTVSDKTIDFFKNEGFIEAFINTSTVTFLISDKLEYDRIAGKIYDKNNIMVASMNIVACNKPFKNDELVLVGNFCEKLSEEISRNEIYNDYGQAHSETLISLLINGCIDDYTLFSDHIANTFDILKDNLYLAVVNITKCKSEHIKIEYFRDLFKQLHTVNRYAIYANYILIIISTDNTSFDVKKELNEINKIFEQDNIYAGISRRFGNVYELQKHYTEAVNALNNGLKNKSQHGGQRIFQYNEVNQIPDESL